MKPLSSPALAALVICGATSATLSPAFAQRPIQRVPIQRIPIGPRVPIDGAPIRQLPANTLEPLNFNPTLVGRIKPTFRINANIIVKSPTILKARGAQSATLLDKDVSVQGFYYDSSVPMIVDDMERTQVDMVMPPESYIPLSSAINTLRNGDEVSITGKLVTPARAGMNLLNENSVLQLGAANQIKKIAPASNKWKKLTVLPNFRFPNSVVKLSDGVKTKYAVLIAGGCDPANNHIRYWNSLKTMYGLLLSRGYSAANITVIYADGVAKDNTMPVNLSATKSNIRNVFKTLGTKLDAGDDLYVMISDHGGGFMTPAEGSYGVGSYGAVLDPTNTVGAPLSESALNMDINWDGDKNDIVHVHNVVCLWGENMTDDEFRDALDQVKLYHTTMIQMNHCFSGGFAQRLAKARRVIMSAAGPNEVAWARNDGQYSVFTYFYLTALLGHNPDIPGTPINADSNGDGTVSMLEAWNYARAQDNSGETPYYTDTANQPLTEDMPNGAQGKLGGKSTP